MQLQLVVDRKRAQLTVQASLRGRARARVRVSNPNPIPNPNPDPNPHPNPDRAVQGLAWSSSSLSYIRYRSMHVKPGVSDVDTITGDDGVAMPVMYLDKRKGTPDGGATFGRQWAKVGGSSWSMRRQCVSVTDTLSPDISISLDCSSGSELEHAVGGFGRSFRRRASNLNPNPNPDRNPDRNRNRNRNRKPNPNPNPNPDPNPNP